MSAGYRAKRTSTRYFSVGEFKPDVLAQELHEQWVTTPPAYMHWPIDQALHLGLGDDHSGDPITSRAFEGYLELLTTLTPVDAARAGYDLPHDLAVVLVHSELQAAAFDPEITARIMLGIHAASMNLRRVLQSNSVVI